VWRREKSLGCNIRHISRMLFYDQLAARLCVWRYYSFYYDINHYYLYNYYSCHDHNDSSPSN
jgi:hypothetical protein